MSGKDWQQRNVLRRRRKADREEDDWMSDGNEFQSSDAATGNAAKQDHHIFTMFYLTHTMWFLY